MPRTCPCLTSSVKTYIALCGPDPFDCRRWYDRKAAKTSHVIATKALGCKLAKAAWHVMAGNCDYDQSRMFPELANKTMKTK